MRYLPGAICFLCGALSLVVIWVSGSPLGSKQFMEGVAFTLASGDVVLGLVIIIKSGDEDNGDFSY